ncbi:MAG: tRNA pseudouridine(55) synthase TruB [Eubacteriaceae bacterium]|nr:tRNA pseudouridine(55) synthase TruB [Eubacteriaceae bacterium]
MPMPEYNGYLNVYKEKGMTSHDVVFRARKILKTKKIGHTGTLDPDAEGVLVLCIGKATKMVEYIIEHEKTYEAQVILGIETDTGDISGKLIHDGGSKVTLDAFEKILSRFTGNIMQKPPIYSAIRIKGKKLYHYARSGEAVEIPERPVSISKLSLLEFSEEKQQAKLMVTCSKGTYIRSLCQDIGAALGSYGCMGSLLRHRVGDFTIETAHKLSEIEKKEENNQLDEFIYSMAYSLDRYRCVTANEQGKKFLTNGNKLYQWNAVESFDAYYPSEILRLYVDNELVGMGSFYPSDDDAYVKPVKLL